MPDKNEPEAKLTAGEIEVLIAKHWNPDAVLTYFAQVLSGECSAKESLQDLLSFEEPKDAR